MELRLSMLSVIFGLLHHPKIVLTLKQINTRDPLSIEKLFQDTFDTSLSLIQKNVDADGSLLQLENCVKFYLFTPDNQQDPYLLNIGDIVNLNLSPFNSARQTKIIIHGWMDRGTSSWVNNFRKNYFIIGGDYNIIAVDWYPLSFNEYPVAVKLTRSVGEYVGELLQFLNAAAELQFSDVHISGHSLGAHIAGFAGAQVSGAIGRITGMDPAGPLFEMPFLKEAKDRLDATDAIFVDIIHTCAGTLGFVRAIGHVDFYPNGGTFTQPGCPTIQSQSCSHSRSHFLMIDSIIYPSEFVAINCDSWSDYKEEKCTSNSEAVMGEYVNQNTRGTYYLKTNANSPFGRG